MKLKTQFIGYLCSGVCATSVHFLVLFLLVDILANMDPDIATSFGYLSGALTGFILNQRFVFKSENATLPASIKYILMAAIGGALNAFLMHFMHHLLHWHYLLAQLIATPTIVIANFFCCRLWIFKEPSHVS